MNLIGFFLLLAYIKFIDSNLASREDYCGGLLSGYWVAITIKKNINQRIAKVIWLTIVAMTFALAPAKAHAHEKIDAHQRLSVCDDLPAVEMTQCLSNELADAEQMLIQYLEAVYEIHQSDAELTTAIELAQSDWERYRQSHCQAVKQLWQGGSVAMPEKLRCQTDLTVRRTYELWQQFLTYADSTPPALPSPLGRCCSGLEDVGNH